VKEVTSAAREGGASVTVDLLMGADNQKVYQDVQQEVDRLTSLPEEAERPQVVLVARRRSVLSVVIYGEQDDRILREMAEQVRSRLLEDEGITQVDLSAVRPFEISIEVPQEKLRAYNLTIEDVARKVRDASIELPGGGIKTTAGEILLRMKERRDYGREFGTIPVVSAGTGTEVLLGDIATIVDDFEDTDQSAAYNGKPAVMVNVYRVGEQTPIEVSDAVKRKLEEVRSQLPPGIGVDIRRDRSEYYRQRMDLLLRNAAIGLALVFILLGFFLESRLAFWVTMGIPISFLGAFLLLPSMGVSINMLSMFAFIVALGIVVDDAIVVGENVYDYHQQGMPFLKAAVRGAREIAMPVIFSILTNIAAFMPLMFIPGTMGKIFSTIPIVVGLVFTISLIECLFILPAHLGHQRERRAAFGAWLHVRQQRFSAWFSGLIRSVYGPFLGRALERRYLTLAAGAAVLLLTVGYVVSGRMGLELMPKVESDTAAVAVVLPYGTPDEKKVLVRDRLVRAAQEIAAENGGDELVKGIFAEIGGRSGGQTMRGTSSSGSNLVDVRVYLTPPEQRPISTAEVAKLWRERVGTIVGAESVLFESDRGGPGSGASVTVELRHRRTEMLEHACLKLAKKIESIPSTKDIDDGFSLGKEQLDFHILPEGNSLGLTATGVARQVRHSFYGAQVLRQQRGRNEVKVMVRLPESERVSEHNLEQLLVRTPAGREAPLREVVRIERGRAYKQINRRNGQRTMTVTANVVPRKQTNQVLDEIRTRILPEVVRDHPGLVCGFEGRQAEMRESIASLKAGFIIAMLLVYGLLAIPFRSYIQPLIIMASIPFGIVGAVAGHMIMGYSLSVISMMGMVALSGVVVNDSLILIDYANRKRKEGTSAVDSVHAAGIRRFRPIMLTTLTTFGGLSPMIFETSRQARFMIPMALSLGYGILFATLISLLLVPCLYLIVEDVKNLWKGSG